MSSISLISKDHELNVEQDATIKTVDAREGRTSAETENKKVIPCSGQTFSTCTRCAQFQPFATSQSFSCFFLFSRVEIWKDAKPFTVSSLVWIGV